MTDLKPPLPSGGLSREEHAKIELGHTAVAQTTTRALLAFFLTAVFAVPLVELASVRTRAAGGVASAWSHLWTIPNAIRSSADATSFAAAGAWDRMVGANRVLLASVNDFERTLEDESVIGRSLRPAAQVLMTRWLGAGNERVYPGHDGWLFYRPDVEYVTGRGFLDRARMQRRIAGAEEWTAPPQPDARPAILRFARDLQARGITLVVVPTPVKPGVHPEMLAGDQVTVERVLQNPSFGVFVRDLEAGGVLVFDPADDLSAMRRTAPQYLKTDTHWRPETMEAIAERLAGFIAARVPLPPVADPGYRLERVEAQNAGDTARMLDLPGTATLFPPERVWLARVLQPDGALWRSRRDADVLVLGDSFSNIYSLESMGWGTSAGFVEQLSVALARPVDRLVQNDEAAFATRAALARDPERLNGKRVVVYQFAMRELAFGDWKVLPVPSR